MSEAVHGAVVLATGGTGGHIYPAVATAQHLLKRGLAVTLLGQAGGMEERIAAQEHLPFMGVQAGKLARSGQGRADARELLRAAQGLAQARKFLAKLRPNVVIGYGGFASLPGVLAAQSLGIPTVLHEQNARLGLTQRLAARRAKAVGTAYPQVLGLDSAKGVMVGMPVREEKVAREGALALLGLQENKRTIFIMGGSQGSLALNNVLPEVLRAAFPGGQLASGEAVQVLHATGPRWVADVAPRVSDLAWYKVEGYVNAAAAWSVADLAITRAGTGTLAEAAFHGVAEVMVPLPESSENHQWHNACAVQEAGAGVVVEQAEVSAKLGSAVLECLQPARASALAQAAQRRASPGAAARLGDLALQHARGLTFSSIPTQ